MMAEVLALNVVAIKCAHGHAHVARRDVQGAWWFNAEVPPTCRAEVADFLAGVEPFPTPEPCGEFIASLQAPWLVSDA